MEREHQLLLSHDLSTMEPSLKWSYYLYNSSLRLYLEKDSVVENLHLAVEQSAKAVCRVSVEETYVFRANLGSIAADHSWYFWDLPLEVQIEFKSMCLEKGLWPGKKKREKVSSLEKRIMDADQVGRKVKNIDWEKQYKIDAENRRILDSLYAVHQSFEPFNNYELDAFSMVLHHSRDCEWNFKWFDIWLEEMEKGNVKGGKALGAAFDRMLLKDKDCCVDDLKECSTFIAKLKNKYPIKYTEQFGYSSY